MSHKSFSANAWFAKEQSLSDEKFTIKEKERVSYEKLISSGSSVYESIETTAPCTDQTDIGQFFVPGWKGESLPSKIVKSFSNIIDQFHQDAKQIMLTKVSGSRRLQNNIYSEFLSFADSQAMNCTHLDSSEAFWAEAANPKSVHIESIAQFIEIFSFRAAIIHLLKIRFVLTLIDQTESKFDLKSINYPNNYLTNAFKKGSALELRTKAFDQNVYSWYRPSTSLKKSLLEYKSICTSIKITEIIKTISTKSEEIINVKTLYSHALSQKNLGLFVNSLIINFPKWLNSLKSKQTTTLGAEKSQIKVISSKFTGDYLESMALSHWLAQYQNSKMKWEEIICPDFKHADFETGLYLKTVNELQFLTFLAELANLQGQEPKKFIAQVVKNNLFNRKNSHQIQKSFLDSGENANFSTYDRIILNMNIFPKNNPHFHLVNSIHQQSKFLKESGLIFVMTSKQLFVPSQKSKVDSLLKDFKLEGSFNLSAIEGRGELGSYIYILSKVNQYLPKASINEKQTCFNFRITGQLNSFQLFSKITDMTTAFFQQNMSDVPPMYHTATDNFKFEFFQDAIVDGRLIHSSSKDSSRVTHPNFFRKLMDSCYPLDYFFTIQNIDFTQKEEGDPFFDLSHSFQKEVSPYTIIVDQREVGKTNIEIISTNSLEAKAYQYGHSRCEYFYLSGKWPNIHVDAIKEYLDSSIGSQIIDLTFNNEMRKVKGNLNKLLIPKFYASEKNILPEHIRSGLSLLSMTPEQLLSLHPTTIESDFKTIETIIVNLVNDYPSSIMSLIATFKRTITHCLDIIGSQNKSTALNFNNPILKTPLLLSKTYSIYPDNKEVYIKFNSESLATIHSKLSKVKKIVSNNDDFTTYSLELYSNQEKVISIYSEEDMILFLDFLLTNVSNIPISQILQGIAVPKLDDLRSILNSYNSIARAISGISEKLVTLNGRLISSTIINH